MRKDTIKCQVKGYILALAPDENDPATFYIVLKILDLMQSRFPLMEVGDKLYSILTDALLLDTIKEDDVVYVRFDEQTMELCNIIKIMENKKNEESFLQ